MEKNKYGIAEIGDAWDRFTSVYEGQELNNLSFDQFWEFVYNPECGKSTKK